MKKLFLDIETTPHVAFVWRLYKENIGLNQVIEPTRMLCVAYQFDGEPMQFAAEWQAGGRRRMVKRVHKALDEADAVVHYNGQAFDEKHLNREFLQVGLTPPSTYKTIDLYRTIKQKFRFASSKLEQVVRELDIRDGKLKTEFDLWRRAMAHERDACDEMERYNTEDVALLVELYRQLLPWIDRHPNAALYVDGYDLLCTKCGSSNVQRRGLAYTNAGAFRRYQCKDCGGWSRDFRRTATTPLREAL